MSQNHLLVWKISVFFFFGRKIISDHRWPPQSPGEFGGNANKCCCQVLGEAWLCSPCGHRRDMGIPAQREVALSAGGVSAAGCLGCPPQSGLGRSIRKLFSFSSTLVERFSGLAGYFIFNYFPNTRQMAGYLRTVRLCSSIKFGRELTGPQPRVRRCLVRSTDTVLDPPLLVHSQIEPSLVGGLAEGAPWWETRVWGPCL